MYKTKKRYCTAFIISIPLIFFPVVYLSGCSSTDKYHNKKHADTIKKDLNSLHKDIDKVLGLDEPSPLTEE